jgi:tetratricopeptide (TPR) repeat protein
MWYARAIAADRLTVLVIAPAGYDGSQREHFRVISELRSRLDPLHVVTRIVSAPAGTMNCALAMQMGAERASPIVLWLAPAPTLIHLARLRPRLYEEHGILTEVPEIEDRCTTFPVEQPKLAIAFSRALALLDMGASRLAADEFDELQKAIAPRGASGSGSRGSAYLSYHAGLAHALQHRPAMAIRDWGAVPESPSLLGNRAVMLTAVRQYEAALAAIDTAIKSSSRDAVLHAIRGNVLRAIGRYEPALRSHETALQLGNDTAPRAYLRGLAVLDSGDEERAQEVFARSTELDPRYAPGYLARVEKRHGLISSDPNVFALLRSQPRDTTEMYAKARALVRANRAREALALYDAILRAEPSFCIVRVAQAITSHRPAEEDRRQRSGLRRGGVRDR